MQVTRSARAMGIDLSEEMTDLLHRVTRDMPS